LAAPATSGPSELEGSPAERRGAGGDAAAGARAPTAAPGASPGLSDPLYLLDTNVVSELRRPRPHRAVLAWLRATPDAALHLAAVTIGELQAGVEITREQDPAKAAEIEAWIDRVAETWNVLPMDARIFRSWARLLHRRSDDLIEDAMIAATAEVHGLVVVTRNVHDFARLGAQTLNPFK
jgi:predicted nucleic acid-binding protein